MNEAQAERMHDAITERDKRIVELESALASIIAMCRADGYAEEVICEEVAVLAGEKAPS